MTAVSILCAVLLDWIFADPRAGWHPVRLVGRTAAAVERILRRWGWAGRAGGCVFLASVLMVCGGPVLAALVLIESSVLKFAVETLVIYFSIALRSLFEAAGRVRAELDGGAVEAARRAVSEICGRDTAGLDEAALTRATVESVAENSVDGFTAPIFFAAIFGPAAAWLYRIVNTLDSMVGYRNEKYIRFGWASARLDDLLNYFPARITAALMGLWAPAAGGRIGHSLAAIARFGGLHPSPNAGWSESAAAGALGIRLGGPSSYGGREMMKPYLGTGTRNPEPQDIRLVLRLTTGASLSFAVIFLAITGWV